MNQNKQNSGKVNPAKPGQAPLPINGRAARDFLAFLDPLDSDVHAFQTYDDDKERSSRTKMVANGRDFRARTLIGAYDKHADTLARMNNDGSAVHVAINYVEGSARIEKNVKRVRKHFIEKDDDEPMAGVLKRAAAAGLKVAWVNESSPGHFHYFWNVALDIEGDVAGFRQRQKLLAALFGAGRESVDPPRVLRLPGFWHQKGKSFQVRKVYSDPRAPQYGVLDFETALSGVELPDTASADTAFDGADEDQAAVEAATLHFKTFARAVSNTDSPDGKLNKKGNATTFDAFAKARDFGVSLDTAIMLAAEFWNPRCDPPWSDDELRTIAANAYRYAKGTAGKDNPTNRARRDFGGSDKVTDADFRAWDSAKAKAKQEREKKRRDTKGTSSNIEGMMFLDADKIKVRNIDFIWPLRLARGKHTSMAGEGGKGKSQIAYDIIARITTGATWPDKSGKAPLGKVIILSAEDGPDDVMVPRLIAAGADLTKVKIVKATVTTDTEGGGEVERKFSLQDDIQKLRKAVEALNKMDGPPVMLILFDPVSSYMGGSVDSFRNTQVRHVLDPITNLAEDVQCAILSITHFNKGTTAKAVNRVMDSAAFVNAPRASFGVFDDVEDIGSDFDETKRFLFLPMKSNIGKFAPGLKYHIEESQGGRADDDKPVITSKIVWDGLSTMTADQVAQAESEQGRGAPRLREAMTFLRDELADGPKPAADVQERAEAEAISPETLRKARKKLRVKAEQVKGSGPSAGWQWSLSVDADGNISIDKRGDGSTRQQGV